MGNGSDHLEQPVFISALILLSRQPHELADFYRRGLGIPLEKSDPKHGDPHFECQLGDVHFAIHPFPEGEPGRQSASHSAIKFAIAVSNLESLLERLRVLGVSPLYPSVDRGFATMTAIRDPEGNLLELTQLSKSWLSYLSDRDTLARDVVQCFQREQE